MELVSCRNVFKNIEAGGDSDLNGLNDHNKNELESEGAMMKRKKKYGTSAHDGRKMRLSENLIMRYQCQRN